MSSEEVAVALIEDERIDDAVLASFFELDETSPPSPDVAGLVHAAATAPPVGSDLPAWVLEIENRSTASEGIMGAFNRRSRRRRQRLWTRRAPGFDGVRIVSEGDSWFQYPVRLRDVIDHLFDRDDFNLYSLGYAGDWMSNLVRHHEYWQAIAAYKPHVFLLSGGGNDMVGKGRLATVLEPYEAGRAPEAYLGPRFQAVLADLERLYRFVLEEVTSADPDLLVVTHGYDYAIPDHGKWLGRPMRRIGIDDPELQRKIVRAMMDQFNAVMMSVAADFDRVQYVDLRGVVKSWHNELHPRSDDFGNVAQRMAAAIYRRL